VWAADAGGGEPLLPSEVGRPAVALVLGNEGAGVSEGVLREADRSVAIPLEPSVESLNVGVAGALLMDRLRESRRDG
jgi:tRNA G18 (ribose-2'-O)-methylase SpoU